MAVLQLALTGEGDTRVRGREFEVEVPPPHCGHPEFVILRARFDAANARCWRVGDACKVRMLGLSNCQCWSQLNECLA